MKQALSIASSDCSGGAGIQADLKTFAANGVYGMSVIVSVVAENTARVIGVEDISPTMIADQIDAIFEDIPVDAVKIGMLSKAPCMISVAKKIRQYAPKNVVIDPVMVAKNGYSLMDEDAVGTLIQEILPLADLLTPNIPEAEVLIQKKILTIADMQEAAKAICLMGPKAVLVKGGHRIEDVTDVLYDGKKFHHFSGHRIDTKNTHGTGCTYSSAIAANLALGTDMVESIRKAKVYVTEAIEHALELGKGCGPTNHFYKLYKQGLTQ
ncbi:bifunctional hydroxymethylpyrimidine kinase/phosphomethylpyrimidine kinase [uncultured Sphaerochaeta sp.]|uniref:bifunctional hydroxymethylpyrimidine kinase/phosphomethylpyrimidine kinase n=1 Tax=uncultured Sphaerochaeta sp. TaxID=886478 RepID=UPI002A0A68C5|nr:bifunctional hydroxymethylpyrimidine kinase/phosphomethylpyrimidine kinase [uncultured Sphaerochaeta sp.]